MPKARGGRRSGRQAQKTAVKKQNVVKAQPSRLPSPLSDRRQSVSITPVPNRRASLRSATRCTEISYAEVSSVHSSGNQGSENESFSSSHLNAESDNLLQPVVSRIQKHSLASSSKHPSQNAKPVSSHRASLRSAKRCKKMENLNAHVSAETVNECILAMGKRPDTSGTQVSDSHSLASLRLNAEVDRFLQLISFQAPVDTPPDDFTDPSLHVKKDPLTSTPTRSGENVEKLSNTMPEENVGKATPACEAVPNDREYIAEQSLHAHGSIEYRIAAPPPATVPMSDFEAADSPPFSLNMIGSKQIPDGESSVTSKIGGERHEESANDPNVGRPGKTFSLNLTEVANMCCDDASSEDEVRFLGSSLVMVEGYQVKEASASILREIFTKHGDIATNCMWTRVESRSHLLEMVCDIIRTLQEKDFKEITEESIRMLLDVVSDLKGVNIRLDWLHNRLDDIFEAKQLGKHCCTLKEANDSYTRVIKEIKGQLEGYDAELLTLQEKKKLCEEKLAVAEAEINKIKKSAREAKPIFMHFYARPLLEGLL